MLPDKFGGENEVDSACDCSKLFSVCKFEVPMESLDGVCVGNFPCEVWDSFDSNDPWTDSDFRKL